MSDTPIYEAVRRDLAVSPETIATRPPWTIQGATRRLQLQPAHA